MLLTNHHQRDAFALAELANRYQAERSRLDAAQRRMRQIEAVPHTPAQAREAARDLSVALRRATADATRIRQAAMPTSVRPNRRHLRRKADRGVPPAVLPWSAELRRLAEIDLWLQWVTLDDKGVHLPETARVANYAAIGPHIAGLDFGNQAADQPGRPRIGIDLMAAIDANDPGLANDPTGRVPTPPAGVTKAA